MKKIGLLVVMVSIVLTGIAQASDDWEIQLNVTPTSGNTPLTVNVQATIEEFGTCDSSHLYLCTTSSTCSSAEGYWWSDSTCKDIVESASCDIDNLDLCTTDSACTLAGGNWWSDSTCRDTTEPPSCDSNNLDLCGSGSTCTSASGYWWCDNTCNSIVETAPAGSVLSQCQVWMDRNLGASQVATSSTDSAAYGDLYQWGRGTDGHEKRTSPTTSTNSSTDDPGHGDFITESSSPNDWRVPQNDNLWQGVSGINNPCPAGFRLPTETELDVERANWSTDDSAGAYASPLKLVVAGYRYFNGDPPSLVGNESAIWSSTVSGIFVKHLHFASGDANVGIDYRAVGHSVRCLED